MKIGYHASHEQFAPSTLLELVKLAESAGFSAAMSSDHFHPWSERQGHSGFAWSWLGAALQATSVPAASAGAASTGVAYAVDRRAGLDALDAEHSLGE